MELWIRSQDKEVLTRVVDIWKDADKNEIWSKSSFATKNCLGIYKTKERAIEVLDEIHKCIVDKEVLDGNNNILTLANKNSLNEVKQILARTEEIAVYEMPKE